MFEDMTFDYIVNKMLARVSSSMDRREGSIIYDALAPAAAELAQLYIDLDFTLNETFADTAHREYLVKRAQERGINPYPATSAIAKGIFNIAVPISSRFSIDIYNYVVTELISDTDHSYKMTCETAGSEPNGYTGRLIPVDYIQGLSSAQLTEILVPGEDEEDTEEFRSRYLNSFTSQAFGGNVADYKEKVNALPGVGGVKVYPVWNGGGTVKVVIVSSEGESPSQELVSQVQTALDPVTNQGEGLGIAPIGHVVTVAGVTESTVNITTTITYADGWSYTELAPYLEEVIDGYFAELSMAWAESDNIIVRISQIESRVLELDGVIDIQNTSLNGVQQNLVLDEDGIPVRGTVSA